MSHNSKNARKIRAAKQRGAQRKNGNKGPKRTTKTNTKRNTWFAKLAGKVGAQAPKREAEN